MPESKKIGKNLKIEFHESVDRSTAKSKIDELMLKSNKFIKHMKHEEILRKYFEKTKIIGFIATHSKLWENLAFLINNVLNIMILINYKKVIN